jgi:hypothetical protein
MNMQNLSVTREGNCAVITDGDAFRYTVDGSNAMSRARRILSSVQDDIELYGPGWSENDVETALDGYLDEIEDAEGR